MANTLDEQIGQHTDEWKGTNQWNRESNHLSQKAPAGLGLGGHLSQGQVLGPQSSVHKTVCQCILSPWWSLNADGSPSQLTPWPHMGLWLHQAECWCLMVDHFSTGSSPYRVCAISTNPGGGHGGLWLNVDCGGIISQGWVVSMSVFVMGVD